MKNLYKVNLKIYWIDYIISTIIFAVSLYSVYTEFNIIIFIIGCILLYRLAAFTHEIAHQNNNYNIETFKLIWNITGGLLILQPSLRFTVPHLKHHETGIFATAKDPQYPLIWNNKKLAAGIFILLPLLIPFYNLLICLFPRWRRLENILYKNTVFTLEEYKNIRSYELYYLAVVLGLLALGLYKLLFIIYLFSIGAWFLSVLRIPLEHPLTEYKKTSTWEDQKILSKTHESPLYIFIQPLGLRYHTLHHMYPKIPYHNIQSYHYFLNKNK